MTDKATLKLATLTRYGLLLAAGGFILAYILIALWRMRHPFELEWMEGAMVDHVQRIVFGRRIYVEASLNFVPFIYPPGFYYVSALVAQVTGVGFVALRLVSFLSSLGVFVLLYFFVKRETADRFTAFVATGLFAATYHIGGSFFDLGRVDSLFLVTLLGGFFILRFGMSASTHAVAGLLIALAFLTKQSAVVMAAPVVLYAIYRHPRRGMLTAAVAGTTMLGSTLLLDALHDGWYWFYVFEIPSGYPMLPHRMVDFWRVDILPPLAISWAVGILYFVTSRSESPRLFYLAMAAGLIAGSWFSRGNPGGYNNVLIPSFLTACLLFGLGLHAVRSTFSAVAIRIRLSTEAGVGLACLLQFGLLLYNPIYKLPTNADAAAGAELVRILSAVDGQVWIPYHGFLASKAGKTPFAHWMAISDVLQSSRQPLSRALQGEIDAALGAGRFELLVMSSNPFLNTPDFDPFYVKTGVAVDDPEALWPVTGAIRRVETLHRPKQFGP